MKLLVVAFFWHIAIVVRVGGLNGPQAYGGPRTGYIPRGGYDFKGYEGYAKEVAESGNRYNGFLTKHCKELNGYESNGQRLVDPHAPSYSIGHNVGTLGNVYNPGGYQRGLVNEYVHSNGYKKVLRGRYGLNNWYGKGLSSGYDTGSEDEKGLDGVYSLANRKEHGGVYEDFGGISGKSNIYEKSLSEGHGPGGTNGKTFRGRYGNFNSVYGKGHGNRYSNGYRDGADYAKRPGGGHGLDDEYEKEVFVLNAAYSKSKNNLYSRQRAAAYIFGDNGKEYDVTTNGGYGLGYGYRK